MHTLIRYLALVFLIWAPMSFAENSGTIAAKVKRSLITSGVPVESVKVLTVEMVGIESVARFEFQLRGQPQSITLSFPLTIGGTEIDPASVARELTLKFDHHMLTSLAGIEGTEAIKSKLTLVIKELELRSEYFMDAKMQIKAPFNEYPLGSYLDDQILGNREALKLLLKKMSQREPKGVTLELPFRSDEVPTKAQLVKSVQVIEVSLGYLEASYITLGRALQSGNPMLDRMLTRANMQELLLGIEQLKLALRYTNNLIVLTEMRSMEDFNEQEMNLLDRQFSAAEELKLKLKKLLYVIEHVRIDRGSAQFRKALQEFIGKTPFMDYHTAHYFDLIGSLALGSQIYEMQKKLENEFNHKEIVKLLLESEKVMGMLKRNIASLEISQLSIKDSCIPQPEKQKMLTVIELELQTLASQLKLVQEMIQGPAAKRARWK